MKSIRWVSLLLLLTGFRLNVISGHTIILIPKARTGSNGIQFVDAPWSTILNKAKAEKKVIFLDAYASWCGPCKMLQKNVFSQKEVGDYFNKQFINVKIDMEKGEGPALTQKYPLDFYPTLFFIDSNGKVLKKISGYHSPENLLAIGKNIKNPN